MIGAPAFFADIALPLVWLLIVLAIVAAVFRPRKTTAPLSQKTKVQGAIVVVIAVGSSILAATWIVRQMQYRSILHDLRADTVDFIAVDNKRLQMPSEIALVVDALRDTRWYIHTAGDGGWASSVPLIIHFRSGEEHEYQVSRLLRQQGGVIAFIQRDQGSGFVRHYGYAYSRHLPEQLLKAGIPLPGNGSVARP